MANKINFSILIPHKNRPELLKRAIHSVPQRDDVQIIVVDDNSDPQIVDFNQFPCINEPHVEVYFTKEGKGAGYARNIGLQYVRGKWLLCLDSDDYFTKEISSLMNLVVEREEDVIFFKTIAVSEPSMKSSSRGALENEMLDYALDSGDYSERMILSVPTMAFYRMDFMHEHNICFHEVRWGNDVWFAAQVSFYAERYWALSIRGYCLTESDNSLVKCSSVESILCRLEEESMATQLLRKRFGKVESLYFWLFDRWKKLWKKSCVKAICVIPKVIYRGGNKMLKYYYNFFGGVCRHVY